MGWGRVGRSVLTSAVIPPLVTGAYAALDAVGSAFEIPYAVGNEGSLIAQAWLMDRTSGLSALRLHLFASAPTPIADNAAFTIPSGTENNYLGWIDFAKADWITAGITGGNTAFMNRAITQNLALYTPHGNRSIYGQFQAPEAQSLFGNTGLTLRLGLLQD